MLDELLFGVAAPDAEVMVGEAAGDFKAELLGALASFVSRMML